MADVPTSSSIGIIIRIRGIFLSSTWVLFDGGKTIVSRTIPVHLFTMFSGDTEGIDEAIRNYRSVR
jgi:hypothetical protein